MCVCVCAERTKSSFSRDASAVQLTMQKNPFTTLARMSGDDDADDDDDSTIAYHALSMPRIRRRMRERDGERERVTTVRIMTFRADVSLLIPRNTDAAHRNLRC